MTAVKIEAQSCLRLLEEDYVLIVVVLIQYTKVHSGVFKYVVFFFISGKFS